MIARCSPLALLARSLVLLVAPPADAQLRRARAETPVETLAAANSAARQSPTRDGFVQARHVYGYEAGALYEVYAHPSYVSTILLEPGETLTDIAAGDTSRWMVTEALSETAEDPGASLEAENTTRRSNTTSSSTETPHARTANEEVRNTPQSPADARASAAPTVEVARSQTDT